MLEVMFVIGFLSYLIQNAATGIISAANRELPPKAKLRMAEIDAARAAGVVAPARYGVRDYLGDWVSDALQHARDDRRERAEARRRGDTDTPAPDAGETSDAPTLATTESRDGRDGRADEQEPFTDVVHDGETSYRRDTEGLWSWTCRRPQCPGKGFDFSTRQDASDAAAGHERQEHPRDPGPGSQVAGPPPEQQPQSDGIGQAPGLDTTPAAEPGIPSPVPPAPARPAAPRSAPPGQPPASNSSEQPPAARSANHGWICEKCNTLAGGFASDEEARIDSRGHVCPNTPPGTTAGEQPAPGQRADLRLVPPPADDEPATDNPTSGQDDRPAPNTDPGARPEQGGTTVSTTASAETTNIEAARVFLEELGEHVSDDLLGKVQTAQATLTEKNIDSETLGILARIQEQGKVLAAICEEGVEHLNDYHGGMEQAVNATEEVADTDFYKHN